MWLPVWQTSVSPSCPPLHTRPPPTGTAGGNSPLCHLRRQVRTVRNLIQCGKPRTGCGRFTPAPLPRRLAPTATPAADVTGWHLPRGISSGPHSVPSLSPLVRPFHRGEPGPLTPHPTGYRGPGLRPDLGAGLCALWKCKNALCPVPSPEAQIPAGAGALPPPVTSPPSPAAASHWRSRSADDVTFLSVTDSVRCRRPVSGRGVGWPRTLPGPRAGQ